MPSPSRDRLWSATPSFASGDRGSMSGEKCAPATIAMRAPGIGTRWRSQRGRAIAGEAAIPMGNTGTPATAPSQRAPGLATQRGPDGPSAAMTMSCPALTALRKRRSMSPSEVVPVIGTGSTLKTAIHAFIEAPMKPIGEKPVTGLFRIRRWSPRLMSSRSMPADHDAWSGWKRLFEYRLEPSALDDHAAITADGVAPPAGKPMGERNGVLCHQSRSDPRSGMAPRRPALGH